MRKLEHSISNLIPGLFPERYRTSGPNFVALVQAYYVWMETQGPLWYSRRILEMLDVDQTDDSFLGHFQDSHLPGIKFNTVTDKRIVIKKILDFCRSKGTEEGLKLLFRFVYGQDIEVYKPGHDVFKGSDGTWVHPVYLEISRRERNKDFVGRQVEGVSSGASAFVDRLASRSVAGKRVDLFYISKSNDIDFITGEKLRIDDDLDGVPIVLGSLSTIDVVDGGFDFTVGDSVSVMSESGYGAVARVASIQSIDGAVQLSLVDGGWGFSSNATVLVSNAVIKIGEMTSGLPDAQRPFVKFETVTFTCPGNADMITANVMAYSSNGVLRLSSVVGTFSPGETVASGNASGKVFLVAGSSPLANVTVTNVVGDFVLGGTVTGVTTGAGGSLTSFDTTFGVITPSKEVTNAYTDVAFSNSGTVGTLLAAYGGSGATFSIGSIIPTETVYLNTDTFEDYADVDLDATAYGFPGAPAANASTSMIPALTFDPIILGTIGSITGINPGIDYTADPFVDVFEPLVAGKKKQDYVITVPEGDADSFIVGEVVTQPVPVTGYANLSVGATALYVYQEIVYQSNGTANTATGALYDIGSNWLLVKTLSGTWNNTSNAVGAVSGQTQAVTAVSASGITRQATGKVTFASNTSIKVRRTSIAADLTEGVVMTGSSSGSVTTPEHVEPDLTSAYAGDNEVISSRAFTGNGSVASLTVVDSGLSYVDREVITFSAGDGVRGGTGIGYLAKQGQQAGYFSSSKGFLSADKYLRDGRYYQDFSYEIQSDLDPTLYSSMVKRVAHVSGTALFGKVKKKHKHGKALSIMPAVVSQT